MNRAVFIDRDGTISRDVPYCSRPEDFELLPGAGEGVRHLNESGFKVIVITNQSGIARGYFTEETLAKIHEKMSKDLEKAGARLDAIYYCPHHPEEGCECRKPKPTLLLQAASDLAIDLGQSYVIGDREMDMEMGRRGGCRASLLVWEGGEEAGHGRLEDRPTFGSVLEAVRWLIRHEEQERREKHEEIQS